MSQCFCCMFCTLCDCRICLKNSRKGITNDEHSIFFVFGWWLEDDHMITCYLLTKFFWFFNVFFWICNPMRPNPLRVKSGKIANVTQGILGKVSHAMLNTQCIKSSGSCTLRQTRHWIHFYFNSFTPLILDDVSKLLFKWRLNITLTFIRNNRKSRNEIEVGSKEWNIFRYPWRINLVAFFTCNNTLRRIFHIKG